MKRDSTARALSRGIKASADERDLLDSDSQLMENEPGKENKKEKDNDAKNREAAKRKRLTASNLDAIMTPGVRYTCVALASQLNSSTRQIKASLSQLVDAGTVRHVQEARTGIYWVPTNDEKQRFEQRRSARRQQRGHTLEGYDAELRRLQSLCMLVRRS